MSPLLRVQPRPGQTFIHIDITKPTDKSLIQQHTLDLAFTLGKPDCQVLGRKLRCQRLRSQRAQAVNPAQFVLPQQVQSAERSRVVVLQRIAARKMEHDPRRTGCGSIGGAIIEPAGHPQMNHQHPVAAQLKQQIFATALQRLDGAPCHDRPEIFRCRPFN